MHTCIYIDIHNVYVSDMSNSCPAAVCHTQANK